MNSDSKKIKKKDKRERKESSKISETDNQVVFPPETEKESILSMLNKLDNVSQAKTRITEEKIRRGLIKSQPVEEEKKIRKKEINIAEVKRKIEELMDMKQDYLDSGEDLESIEIAKKIIDIAGENNMNLIVNEEKRFIDQIQSRVSPKKPIDEQIEELKNKRHEYYTQKKYDEAIQIAEIIIELANEANMIQVIKTEENFIKLMKEKLDQRIKKAESVENFKELSSIKLNQIQDSVIEEKNKEHIEKSIIEIDKFNKQKSNFEEEKERFQQMKLEFEKERKEFLQEKQKFEEEKKAFKWE